MHGMGDFANNPMGMVPLRKLIAQAGRCCAAEPKHSRILAG